MEIDLLQVHSQSFSAKGQGESALTANKTRVCFRYLKVRVKTRGHFNCFDECVSG